MLTARNSGLYYYPGAIINNVTYKGQVNATDIFEDVCNSILHLKRLNQSSERVQPVPWNQNDDFRWREWKQLQNLDDGDDQLSDPDNLLHLSSDRLPQNGEERTEQRNEGTSKSDGELIYCFLRNKGKKNNRMKIQILLFISYLMKIH